MKVTYVQNSARGGPGLLGDYLAQAGWSQHRLVTYHDVLHHSFASLEADLVVVLGSPRGVYEDEEAWIRREHEMVEHLLARDIPILGICFGAQLLAKVLGGSVRPMERPYRDWLENDVYPLDLWRGPWLRWHGDRIYPPRDTGAIASHDGVMQAFRHKRSFGLQFHPEATIDILRAWIGSLPEAERESTTRRALAYYTANEHAVRQRSFALFAHVLDALGIGTGHREPGRDLSLSAPS